MTCCSHVLFPSHLGFLVGSSWCENFNETEIVVLSTWFLVWVSDVLAHTSIDWHTSLRLGLRLVLSKRPLPECYNAPDNTGDDSENDMLAVTMRPTILEMFPKMICWPFRKILEP